MWRISRFLFTGILVAGCVKLPVEVKYHPWGSNTAIMEQTEVQSSTDSLVFDLQVGFLEQAGFYDIGGVTANDFSFTSLGTYHILDFSESTLEGTEDRATMILLDQSGSYATLDPYNYRTKMINRFIQDVQSPGKFMVGGFSTLGKMDGIVELGSAGFTSDWQSLQDFMFQMPLRTGGVSDVYDGLFVALNKFSQVSAAQKSVVLLVHDADGGSATNLLTVINKALSMSVKVHVLYFGKVSAVGDFSKLAAQTGGMMAILPSDKELITIFNQLHRLLSGQRYAYNIRVSFTPQSRPLSVAGYTHELHVFNNIDNQGFNPVVIYTPLLP